MDIEKQVVENWIVLTLTNLNPSASSTCTLFKQVGGQYSTTSDGQYVPNIDSADFGNTFKITYAEGIVQTTVTTPVLATISDLVDYVNTLFGNDVAFSTQTSGTTWNLYSFSSQYGLVKIQTFSSGIINSIDINANVIQGSSVDVTVESSDLTYNEIVSELQYQPYLLKWVSVYANTLNQANQTWSIDNREASGKLYDDYRHPALNPMFRQFVNPEIKLDFSPSSTNILQYTVAAGESVRVIFGYTHKELLTLPEKAIVVPKLEIIELPDVIESHKSHPVPMLDLIKKHTYNPNGNFLKKIIRPYVKPDRIITKEEVYSAFLGSDYKEL